ncbi:MAG: ABC transporter ATP-binding protein [Actinomycetota bacterium]|jgi:peptide/nickel transport system ATP-binding protein
MKELLRIDDLHVSFETEDGLVKAVDGVSLSLSAGETVAIVGESGSGKTVTSLAVMDLHNRGRTKLSGSIKVQDGEREIDIASADPSTTRDIRGRVVSMIFQDPMSSLHPYFKISDQLTEAYLAHHPKAKKAALDKAISMLELVGIPQASKRVFDFPHQFSGGMRQRVMIAMALMNDPKILIADEPTTALDVTVQAQILTLLADLQKKMNMGILLITHDLGVVAQVADRVNVMYAGRIVETGEVDDIFYKPLAPYTLGLLNSIPRHDEGNSTKLHAIAGQPPSLINLPVGCAFAPRCEFKSRVSGNLCDTTMPELTGARATHKSRCHIDESTRASDFTKLLVK